MRAAVALLLALAARPGPERELAFHPEAGASVRKTFTERTEWTLDSANQIVGGERSPMPEPEMDGRSTRDLVVIDTYGAVDAGVPLLLRRHFEQVESTAAFEFAIEGMEARSDIELECQLQGEKVVFERESAGDEATARFEGEEHADSALLRGVREDLDLRGFLPAEDMGVEDWWEVDAAQLADVLAPGGELSFAPPAGTEVESEALDPVEALATASCQLAEARRETSGEATLTWQETRKEGGRELAVIGIEIGAKLRGVHGGRLLEMIDAAGLETERDGIELETEWTAEGKGQLVWDLTADRCESFQLALDVEIAVSLTWKGDGERVGYAFGLSGKSELAAEFEAR